MIIIDCEQGSPEWFAARAGKATASRIADLRAKTRSGWGASRGNYLAELVTERMTGQKTNGYTNAAMQWGIDTEPQARAMYELMNDVSVVEVGLVQHPSITDSLASPDGLVGIEGLVEIKCPQTATHIRTLLEEAVDGKYVQQMQWQMVCTSRKWCDFVSFDPRMPANMQLFVKRVERDDKLIKEIETDVIDFLKEVDETVEQLTSKYGSLEIAA